MKRLINLEVTPFCLANCKMCPRHLILDKGYLNNITFEKILNRIKEFKKEIFEISIAGRGEPLLHPTLPQIVEKLKEIKHPVSIVTTCQRLDRNNFFSIGRNVDMIRISVSSRNIDIFEKIHRGLNYFEFWENIKWLSKNFKNKIVIHMVGGEDIYPGLEDTIIYLKNLGIYKIFLFPLWNRGGITDEKTKDIRIQLKSKYDIQFSEEEYSKNLNMTHSFCYIGDSSLAINYKGEYIGCFQDFGNYNIEGNVFSNSLDDILDTRINKLGKYNICTNCNAKKEAIT